MAEIESGFSYGEYSYTSSSGGGGMGNYYTAAANSVIQGIAGSTSVYGAWYEGEQQREYYYSQAELTYYQKQQALRKMESESSIVKNQAMVAEHQADYIERINEYKEKKYQDESDSGVALMYANMAKSGADVNYGSPLEVIGKVVEDRSEGYAMTKWAGQQDVYQKRMEAKTYSDKATIMLDEYNMNSQLYDYQAKIYKQAGDESRRAARYKGYGIALNAISTSLSSF